MVVDYLRDTSFQAVENVMLLCPANNFLLAGPFVEGRNMSFLMLHLWHWVPRLSHIQAYSNSLADFLHDSVTKESKALLQTPLVDSEKLSQIDHGALRLYAELIPSFQNLSKGRQIALGRFSVLFLHGPYPSASL